MDDDIPIPIPGPDADFDAWADKFVAAVREDPASYGLSAEEVATLIAAREAWKKSYAAHLDAQGELRASEAAIVAATDSTPGEDGALRKPVAWVTAHGGGSRRPGA